MTSSKKEPVNSSSYIIVEPVPNVEQLTPLMMVLNGGRRIRKKKMKMARKFVKITADQLQKKINYSMPDGHANLDASGYAWPLEIPEVKKDLKKCEFDFENHSEGPGDGVGPQRLMGFCTLNNGLSFLGMCAGGDWEWPVFFILYSDGYNIRAYIPKKGNPWNPKTKSAYGNNDDQHLGFKHDADEIEKDIRARLKLRET